MIIQPPVPEKPMSSKAPAVHNVSPIVAMHMSGVELQGNNPFLEGRSKQNDHPIQDPPPYSPNANQAVIRRTPSRLPPLPQRETPPPKVNVTNDVYIKTKHEAIRGTFNIDPTLTTVALDKHGAAAIDRKDFMHKHRQKHRHHKRRAYKKNKKGPLDPSVILGTNDAPISVELSLLSPPGEFEKRRTLVQASTKRGDIDMHIKYIDSQRTLVLEVANHRGNIAIFLPRAFSGYIQAHSPHGSLRLLPSFVPSSQLVAQYNHESQFIVGVARNNTPQLGDAWEGDMIHVSARRGDIYIGYIGEDSKPAAEPTIWAKLGQMFKAAAVLADKKL